MDGREKLESAVRKRQPKPISSNQAILTKFRKRTSAMDIAAVPVANRTENDFSRPGPLFSNRDGLVRFAPSSPLLPAILHALVRGHPGHLT